MQVELISKSEQSLEIMGEYRYYEMRSGKHAATVCISLGTKDRPAYLRVVVHNAANRTWRGLGHQFPTVESALSKYKTEEIKAMIRLAYDDAHAVAH